MIIIRCKYEVHCRVACWERIRDKLKELNIDFNRQFYSCTICGREVNSCIFECSSDKDALEKFIEFADGDREIISITT